MTFQAEQVINTIRQLAELDFATLPGPVFMGKFRLALIKGGWSSADAEHIAAGMELDILPGMFTDSQLDELATQYARMCDKLRAAMEVNGFTDSLAAAKQVARSLTLKCN